MDDTVVIPTDIGSVSPRNTDDIIETAVRSGGSAEEIADYAEEIDIDVIVTGTAG